MAEPNIVFLMYHELELPGRPTVQSPPGLHALRVGRKRLPHPNAISQTAELAGNECG